MESADIGALPAGTVTFLLTDIENSSGHWEATPDEMRAALTRHDALASDVVTSHDGVVVKHLGDGCWAAFSSAPRAAAAAIEFQRRHQEDARGHDLELRVRIGLHTGDIEPTGDDYFGPAVNRAARVVDLANGDQIVCSAATAGLLTEVALRSEGPHELRGLGEEEIYLVLADGMVTDPRPLRRAVRPTNLPRPVTSFLGREGDVDRLGAYVTEPDSVVTLIGPGGVGKTRLALEIGAHLLERYRGNVHFCDLVPIADGDAGSVAEALAQIVGARRQPGMDLIASMADHLGGRDVLIILDNCEHVIDAVRELVDRFAEVEGVSFLNTSRQALGVPIEQQVVIDPLSAAAAGVDLFVDRARQRDVGFELTDDNREAVLAIVERLDGMPLAIELAAARIRLMTPSELAERLESDFGVLGRARGDRHQTLQDTVRWSYALLSEDEAALFSRLCVFAGGFSLEAAEAVCVDGDLVDAVDVPDLLMALVDKSMVVSTAAGGRQRFNLLETLRAFAADELEAQGTSSEYRRRHADHFAAVARRQNERLFSADEADAWRALAADWTNFRVALETDLADDEIDRAAGLVLDLGWYACTAMRFEAFSWAEELLATPDIGTHPTYADLCGLAAVGAYFTVRGDTTDLADAGLAADPTDPQSFCRLALAAVAMNNAQSQEAADAVTTAWLAAEPATIGGQVWANCFRTFYLCTYDPTPEAARRAQAAAALAEQSGSTTAKAVTAWAEGQVVSFQDMDEAMRLWEVGLDRARSLPGAHVVDHQIEGLILHLTVRRGELSSSLRGCRDAVRGALERHYYAGTSHLFGVTAIALCRAGDASTGACLVGAMTAKGHEARRNARRALEEALGPDLDDHLDAGRSLSITQAGQLALEALDTAIARTEQESG